MHSIVRRHRIPREAVVVIDEAGMLGSRQMLEFVERVQQACGKLVLVGDHRQLPELEAGGALSALASQPNAIRLEENRRQTEAWERVAVEHLR